MPALPPGQPLELLDVVAIPAHNGGADVTRTTSGGPIPARLQDAVAGTCAALWVFGAGGGLGGPAGGVYQRLGAQFAPAGVASLELACRRPAVLAECVADVRVGLWLRGVAGLDAAAEQSS